MFVSFHSNKYILIWMVKSKTHSVSAPFLLFSWRWRAVMCLKTNLFSFHLLLSAWGSCIRVFSSSTFTFQHNCKQLRAEKHLSGPKTSRGVCRRMEFHNFHNFHAFVTQMCSGGCANEHTSHLPFLSSFNSALKGFFIPLYIDLC